MAGTIFSRSRPGITDAEADRFMEDVRLWYGTALMNISETPLKVSMDGLRTVNRPIANPGWIVRVFTIHVSDDTILECPLIPDPTHSYFTMPGIHEVPSTLVDLPPSLKESFYAF